MPDEEKINRRQFFKKATITAGAGVAAAGVMEGLQSQVGQNKTFATHKALPKAIETGEGKDILHAAIAVNNLATTGVTTAYAAALAQEEYQIMLRKWNIKVDEATTPDLEMKAHDIRKKEIPAPYFDLRAPASPTAESHLSLATDIITRESEAAADWLGASHYAHTFIVRQDGRAVGTFRLTPIESGGRKNLLIDRVFLDKTASVLSSVNDVMELSYRNNPIRSLVQFGSILALTIARKALEFAQEHDLDHVVVPALAWKTMPFRKIGLEQPKENVMAHDDLKIARGSIRDMIKNAPAEVLAIIDPDMHFHDEVKAKGAETGRG